MSLFAAALFRQRVGQLALVPAASAAPRLFCTGGSSSSPDFPRKNQTIYNIEKPKFRKQMTQYRKRYQEEMKIHREREDEAKREKWAQIQARKQQTLQMRAEKKAAAAPARAEAIAKLAAQKEVERKEREQNRLQQEARLKARRQYQLEALLQERKKHWVLDWDKDLKGDHLFDKRFDLKGFWVKPAKWNRPKKSIMNMMDDNRDGYETNSDDERELLDYERINQESPETGHMQNAR